MTGRDDKLPSVLVLAQDGRTAPLRTLHEILWKFLPSTQLCECLKTGWYNLMPIGQSSQNAAWQEAWLSQSGTEKGIAGCPSSAGSKPNNARSHEPLLQEPVLPLPESPKSPSFLHLRFFIVRVLYCTYNTYLRLPNTSTPTPRTRKQVAHNQEHGPMKSFDTRTRLSCHN